MLERQISLPEIVRSNEASVMKLRQENYQGLYVFVTACVKNYLDYCFPQQVNIAAQFATDLIETRPAWKAADFINLFKFFRQNPHIEGLKIFGNTITGQRLMEMVAVYEEHRAMELEKLHQETKGNKMRPVERTHGESDIKKLMGNLADQAAARQEEKRQKGWLNERSEAPDENYFKREHGI